MKKMMEQHRKFMAGKAGFSLVELIIVIAIMAALVAVLAPQYIKYVEKSREAADKNTIIELMDALKVASVDEDHQITSGTVTVSSSGTTVGTTNKAAIESALNEYYGSNWSTAKVTSAKCKTAGVTITVAAGEHGSVSITSTSPLS